MTELNIYKGFFYTYMQQGCNKHGTPIYIINIWDCEQNNINRLSGEPIGKYENIRKSSRDVKKEIQQIIDRLDRVYQNVI